MKCIVLILQATILLNLIIFSGLPGRPNPVLANTIGPGMVLVIVNPSSSGGLPTSYNVTISNGSSKLHQLFSMGLQWSPH